MPGQTGDLAGQDNRALTTGVKPRLSAERGTLSAIAAECVKGLRLEGSD